MTVTFLWIVVGWLSGWLLLKQMTALDMPLHANSSSMDGVGQESEAAKRPMISVIVPARNEESNLGKLLNSLAKQSWPALEVIVADDGSADRTAEIATLAGARVIAPGTLPEGWFGKSWACWNGAMSAKGELLVFLDADTTLHSEGLQRLAVAYGTCAVGGLLTVQPYHQTVQPFEQLSALCNLVVLASIHAADGRAGAFGPCVVCSRDVYFQVGGHSAVGGKVLENHALGHVFQSLNKPVRNYAGQGIISFRMYPQGLRSLVAGWGKSFSTGAAATPLLRLAAIVLWVAGAVSAVMLGSQAVTAAMTITTVAVYLAYAIQHYVLLRRAGSFGLATALLFPLPLLMFLYIFIWSAIQTFLGGKVQWKGRTLSTKKERRRL